MTRTSVLLAAALLAACTAKNPERERPAAVAQAEAPAEPAKQDPPKQDPPKQDPPKQDPPAQELPPPPIAGSTTAPAEPAPAGSTTAPAEPAQAGDTGDTGEPAAPAGPAALVATAITATDHTPTWREVATLPADAAPTGFYPFATGILTGKPSAFYSTDAAGALVPVVGLETPPGAVSGHWPGEAWSFQYKEMNDRAVTVRVRVLRLRGGTRWVPQTLLDDQWQYSDDVGLARKSWRIGYLVEVKRSLVRLASNGLEDPSGLFYRGNLMDIVESKAGDLFTLTQEGGYFVQIACPDQACVDANATPLPTGAWEWVHSIPRQKHSVSLTLREPATDRRTHLLHYETGGWKLEALPDGDRLAGLWPTADGGLWAQTAGALYHRDPAGAWRKVALPEGVQPTGPVFAAMTGDMSELWLVGTRSGAQVVLATPARAQAPG